MKGNDCITLLKNSTNKNEEIEKNSKVNGKEEER
jgi:hypothetical protein